MIDANKFIDEQLKTWPLAAKNFDALSRVEEKAVGSWARVQFNPARIASTGAKVDAASLKQRPCFLCAANRPAEQMSIDWGDYEILINPFPIFHRHLTIPLKGHHVQNIDGRIADMARLAEELPGYTVFYNGPKCGASAPDHMHFQAGNTDFLPLWRELEDLKAIDENIFLPAVGSDVMPGVIVIKSKEIAAVEKAFAKVYSLLATDQKCDGATEPMMNVLCRCEDGTYEIAVIPRRRHRPSFYGDGRGEMLLSPASVDLAGVFITPREKDFKAFDENTVRKALREVCYAPDDVEDLFRHQIKVGIMTEKELEIELFGTYSMDGDEITGKVALSARDVKEPIMLRPTSDDCYAAVKDVTIGVNFHWQRKEEQKFKGKIYILPRDGELTLINILSIEDYLQSVISSEMSATSQLELLKAHAVISRSWALAQILHKKEESKWECIETPERRVRWYGHDDHDVFDVCADDHCQRYQGITRQTTEAVAKAVNATRGQVLTAEDGTLCDARFSKCCGGVFEEFESCWEPEHKSYLVARRDSAQPMDFPDLTIEENAREWILSAPEAFCNTNDKAVLQQVLNGYDQETADFYRWTVEYSADELAELVARRTGIDFGRIIDLVPVERGTSGRIITLRIVGEKCTMEIGKELEIRRSLSESHLYSSAFVPEKLPDGGFRLRGAGWGHGVGLCQIGAAIMASKGYGYMDILAHYYPGSQITIVNT